MCFLQKITQTFDELKEIISMQFDHMKDNKGIREAGLLFLAEYKDFLHRKNTKYDTTILVPLIFEKATTGSEKYFFGYGNQEKSNKRKFRSFTARWRRLSP